MIAVYNDVMLILCCYNFNYRDLIQMKTLFVIDDYHQYNEKQQIIIFIVTESLQIFFRAVSAYMIMMFMIYQNSNRISFRKNEQQITTFLNKFFIKNIVNNIMNVLETDNLSKLLKNKKLNCIKNNKLSKHQSSKQSDLMIFQVSTSAEMRILLEKIKKIV